MQNVVNDCVLRCAIYRNFQINPSFLLTDMDYLLFPVDITEPQPSDITAAKASMLCQKQDCLITFVYKAFGVII